MMGREHWIETTLGQIATHPQYGWTTKAGRSGKYKYFRTTDIDSTINWGSVPYCVQIPQNPDDYTIRKNDILVSRAGSIGYNIRFDEDHLDTLFASYLIRFRPINPIDSKFISYYLQTNVYWSFINESQSGIAVPNVNATKLSELPFPLPPLGEQKRIVEKLDDILPKVESTKARLEAIPVILKKFRQSVLAAACSGRLTEDWREGKGDIEKVNIDNIDSYDPDSIYTHTSSTDLPETWSYTKFSSVGKIISGGTPSRSNPDYWEGDIPWVSAKDMKYDLITSSIDKITSQAVEEARVKIIPTNSLLFVVRGMILIHTFPVAVTQVKLAINQDLKALLPCDKYNSKYLLYFFKSQQANILQTVKEASHGTRRLEMTTLGNWAIATPPLMEQDEIVQRVERLFSLADSIEEKYNKAMGRVDNIEQSVLAKAFRGELVDPDPDDEPVDALLARIFEEKGKIEDEGRSRKARKRKGKG